MTNRDAARLRAAWDRRQLASKDRAGRYAKAKALEMNLGLIKRAWLPLLFIGVAPSIAVPLAFLFAEGALRGYVIGAATVSGPWLIVVSVLYCSGAGALSFGGSAEEWTASELRRRKEWRLVNDLTLDQQIDHVAVGPRGVVVVETKWAADGWDPADRFMADRLERACSQAAEARRKVELWQRRLLNGAPVYGALVLWSPNGTPGVDVGHPVAGQISIVPGFELRHWLSGLPPANVPEETVAAIWGELRDRARRRDDWSIGRHGPLYRPVTTRLIRSVAAPVIAVLSAFYLAAALAQLWWPLLVGELALAAAGGIWLRRHAVIRPAATAWTGTNLLLLLLWLSLVAANIAT